MSDQENSNEKKRWCAWCAICSCLLLLLNLALLLLPVGAIFYFLNIKQQDKLDNLRSGGSTAEADLTYPDDAPSTEEIGHCIDEYIKEQIGERGLYGYGEDIANAGQIQDVNPGFIVAIGQAESELGRNITRGDYNYWNYLPTSYGYDFASWEDSINQHAGNLNSFISNGQNTIVKIGQGENGTYVPKTSEKYAANDCDKAVVDPPAYCPCGYAPDGRGYGTSTDFTHDPNKVNQYWIGNVTRFFDQVAERCSYLRPPTPGQAEWCWPTNTKAIHPTGHFRDPNYSFNETDPETGETVYTHEGIDIIPTIGNEEEYIVKATKSGTVTKVVENCVDGDQTCNNGAGNEIVIDHGNNKTSKYWHLATNSVIPEVGESVTKNEEIATINNTGFSFGDHLHFEIWFGDTPQNPETLLGDCSSSSSACRDTILQVAKEKVGMEVPVNGSCCAEFVSIVLDEAQNRGATLSPEYEHTSRVPRFVDFCEPVAQENCDPEGQNMGIRIENLEDVLPGDLLVFHYTSNQEWPYTFSHIGIMGEDGIYYDCSGKVGPSRISHNGQYVIDHFAEGRRICEDGVTTTTCDDPNTFVDPIADEYYNNGSCYHNPYDPDSGVDIACPIGTPVRPSACGTVMLADYNAYAPWAGASTGRVRIRHANGSATYYTHLQTVNVTVGQTVSINDIIGTTGTANGNNHVHVGYYPNADAGDNIAVLHYKSLVNKFNGDESEYPGWGYDRQWKFSCEVGDNVGPTRLYPLDLCEPGESIFNVTPINF